MLFIINDSIKSSPVHSIKNSCTESMHDCLCPGRWSRGWTWQVKQRHGDTQGSGTEWLWGHHRATAFECTMQGLNLWPGSLSNTQKNTEHWTPSPKCPSSQAPAESSDAQTKAFALSHNIRKDSLVPKHFSWGLVAKGEGTSLWMLWVGKLSHTHRHSKWGTSLCLVAELTHLELVRYLSKQILLSHRWASFMQVPQEICVCFSECQTRANAFWHRVLLSRDSSASAVGMSRANSHNAAKGCRHNSSHPAVSSVSTSPPEESRLINPPALLHWNTRQKMRLSHSSLKTM